MAAVMLFSSTNFMLSIPVVPFAILMGFLGAIVGSFLAVVSIRLPREQSFVLGRSRCETCERLLAPWRLVPIVSWIVQRGRCGWCRAPISRRYVLIESAGVCIGVWAALSAPTSLMALATAVLGWQLLLIAVIDAEHFWLPDGLTLPLIATGLIFGVIQGNDPWGRLWGAVAGFAVLWTMAKLYRLTRGRDGLGAGDPVLLAGAGAWVGWTGLPSVLLLACLVGGGAVAVRLATRRAVKATDRLPFGTYLAVGIWATWIFGPLGL